MSSYPLGLLLVGAASVCSCAEPGREQVQASQPLLAATLSTRSDVVAVMATRGIDEQLCTGTLLLPNLVLTARHCLITDRAAINSGDCATAFVAEPDAPIRVVAIAGTDVDLVPAASQVAVREYLLPQDAGRLCGQDIALMLLDKPIEGSMIGVTSAVPDAPFTAVGYGLFDGDWGQQRARSDAKIMCAGAACSDARLVDGEFLAQSGACEGDSGGPAFDASGRQFALVSRSTADCSETAYLGLGGYFDWLKAGVTYAATEGGYAIPAWAAVAPINDSGVEPVTTNAPTDARARGGCAMSHDPRSEGMVPILLLAALVLGRRKAR